MSSRTAPSRAEGYLKAGDPIPPTSTHADRAGVRQWCLAPGTAQTSNGDGAPVPGSPVACSRTFGHPRDQHEAAGVLTILATWPVEAPR